MSSAERSQLDHSLVSGMAWTAALRWVAQLISWAATFIAARLLTPGDYGIASMAMIPIGLVRMVEYFGLDAILVQDRTIVGERQARVAGLVIAVGVAMAAAFALLAPLVARFFNEPSVAPAVAVLGLLCLIDALQVIPRAGLQRELQFAKLAWSHVIQVVATQGVLLALALAGAGYLAVVVNTVAGAATVTVFLIAWHPYAVRWPSQVSSLARPLLQGWRVLVSRVAWYGYGSADQTLIGRVLGKDAVGAYSFAMTFANVALEEIGSAVSRVVPGVFSEVQHQRAELRRYFLVLTELLSHLTLPAVTGLALTADQFVRIVLGPQWDTVVAPLRVLCLYVAFQSCQVLVSHLLLWTGQFRPVMWFSVLTAAALPLSMWFAVRHGLSAVAWMWAIVYPLTNIPPIVLGFRTIEISVLAWLRALLPAGVACLGMSAAVLALRAGLGEELPLVARFAACVGVGALVYGAVVWFGFRTRCLALWEFLRGIRRTGPKQALALAEADPAD